MAELIAILEIYGFEKREAAVFTVLTHPCFKRGRSDLAAKVQPRSGNQRAARKSDPSHRRDRQDLRTGSNDGALDRPAVSLRRVSFGRDRPGTVANGCAHTHPPSRTGPSARSSSSSSCCSRG